MRKALNRASVLLLLLLGVYPQVYLVSETLRCTAEPRLALWLLALCLWLWIAACFRKGIYLGMPLSALTLYAAYRSLGGNPAAQLVDLFDRITGVYYERFYAPGRSYVFSDAVPSHALVLLFLGFLAAAYLASALSSRSGRVPITLIGALPLPLLCLAINGEPSALCILALLLFVLLLIVGGSSYAERGGDGAAVFSALLPVTILLCVLLLVYDPGKYSFTERDVEVSQRFDLLQKLVSDWVRDKSAELESRLPEALVQELPLPEGQETQEAPSAQPSPSASAAASLELPQSGWGELGAPLELTARYDEDALQDTVLRVRSDRSGQLYLRLCSYGDYTGTGWALCTDVPPLSSLHFAASAVAAEPDSAAQRAELRTEQPCPYAFVPYYCAASSPEDSFVPADGVSYALDIAQPVSDVLALRLSGAAAEQEAAYRDYAHAVYTRLPQETASAVRAICAENGLSADDPALMQAAAQFIRSRVSYDIGTAPYPSGDCALYFLTEAETGYCIHYASAAAVLFRSLGVPARVTVGYLAQARAGQSCTVTEADAHAWVEVYRDGLGWIPVEVTGQQGSEQPQDTAQPVLTEAPGETAQPENGASDAPTGTQVTPSPSPAPLPLGPVSGGDTAEAGQSAFPWGTVIAVLFALLLAALPFGWYRLARARFLRALGQDDRRKAAVAVYRAAQRLGRFGADLPEAVRVCAEKASFSLHAISREELDASRAAFGAQLNALYPRLRLRDKLLLKYGMGYK